MRIPLEQVSVILIGTVIIGGFAFVIIYNAVYSTIPPVGCVSLHSIRQPGTYEITVDWRGQYSITSKKDGLVGYFKHRALDAATFYIDLIDKNELSESYGMGDFRPETFFHITVYSFNVLTFRIA